MKFKMTMLTMTACFLSLAAASVQAQSRNACAPRDTVVKRLADKYGETRQSLGLGANNTVIEVFASPETGSWTITATAATGLTCLVASGQAFEAVMDALPVAGTDI